MANSGALKRNLGLWSLVGLGLGYMTSTTVFDTFGIVSEQTDGAVPSAYLIALVVMFFTAISYGKMTRAYPVAGSAYTYTRETMSPGLGFMVGWTALLDYILLPMVNCLIIRLYMESMFPGVPPWIWVVIYAVVMSAIVAYSMKGTSIINLFLVVFAAVMVVTFVTITIVNLNAGAGQGVVFSLDPIYHDGVEFGALLTGATVVCFSFVGFDAVSMYTEEARDVKLMPKAIVLTVLIGGAIFFIASYFCQMAFPDNSQFVLIDDPLVEIGGLTGGAVFQALFVSAAFAATLASGLASHASVARLMMVMGRNGVLPRKVFGYVSPKTHTPVWNILIAGAVCLLAINLSLELVTAFINFGALIAFTFVNLTVIAEYAVRRKRYKTPRDIFSFIVMPLVGAGLTGLLWANLHLAAIIGGAAWALVGLAYLAFLTKGFKLPVRGFDENDPEVADNVPDVPMTTAPVAPHSTI